MKSKKRSTISSQLFIMLGILLTASYAQTDTFKVTREQLTQKPISPLLYSNFIELGYGVQVEPMWSEMLFNRSFEAFFPYKPINIEWFDLWIDNDPSKGYKTDWTREDWYHSGYEHNAWFACPGSEGSFRIADDSTFIIEKSPVLDVKIQLIEGGSGHGMHGIKIMNNEPERWGGLAQERKLFKKGETYTFRGKFKSEGKPVNAELRIYPEKSWDNPVLSLPIPGIFDEFSEKRVDFQNKSYEGRVTFSLWIPPQSTLVVDDFSLMPTRNIYGWRPEVIEAAKQVNPGVIRFPGGCFASFYNWKDGIGPYSERNPQPSYFWGGFNYNDVGTAEFAMFCREIGSEMMFCVNVYHPLKVEYEWNIGESKGKHGFEFQRFSDLEQGARNAANWVAYCNLAKGKHPMADLRAKHGYDKPFGVKYWEMDNEVYRWFEPNEYANAVVVYSKAMKAVDPTIKIGMVTYGDFAERNFTSQLPLMLDIAGPYIDFLADRRDSQDGLDHMLTELKSYNQEHGAEIFYCETEWLGYEGVPDAQNRYDYEGDFTKSFMFSKWYYAMNVIKNYMSWQRRGGDVCFVNFNNFANTHSQSVIETPKEGVYLTAVGRVFELLSRSPAAWPLKIENYNARVEHEFQVQAASSRDKKSLILYVCNRTNHTYTTEFDISDLKENFKTASLTKLSAAGPFVMNTLQNKDAIKREEWALKNQVIDTVFSINAAPFSFVQVVLE